MSMFVSMDPNSSTLSIQQIEAADAGDYVCVAVNLAGTAQAKIKLDVGCKYLLICHVSFLNMHISIS